METTYQINWMGQLFCPQGDKVRILLADQQTSVRAALRLLLEQDPDFYIIGEANNTIMLEGLAAKNMPDIILLDPDLPGSDSDNYLQDLKSTYPKTIIIALSSRPEARKKSLSSGLNAFVSKSEPPEALLTTISRLMG
jgi:two-component system response regulator DesR